MLGDRRSRRLERELNRQLKLLALAVLSAERSLREAPAEKRQSAENLLVSFLMSFASRAATRERLNLFTTNYDRFVEYGCDLAGLYVLDRFVGALEPIFRSTRLSIDVHYNPPGIRGEPRYLEGVIRLNKLHGSLDWRWEGSELRRFALTFGAQEKDTNIPKRLYETAIIYPNPAKNIETLDFPYSELFRDFAAALCRPNSSLVTYGYGFGDEHINSVIKDMLTIPSTHLVVIAWDRTNPNEENVPENASRVRIRQFLESVGKDAQISLLLGSHFGDLRTLVENYLPKPAIDYITIRQAKLLDQRGESRIPPAGGSEGNDQTN